MEKSDLQLRAERAVEEFSRTARKPIVLEFAGMPKAGKTTIIAHLYAFLRRCGFRTEVVVERASVCPIRDKKHANFNVWTACTTLAQLLEKTQDPPRADDPHVLILDRGLFDAILWMTMLERLARIRGEERQVVERFLNTDDWRKRITAVVVMTVSPRDAMVREEGLLPVAGATGSIMNLEVLSRIRETVRETTKRLERQFHTFTIDTSSGDTKDDPQRTVEMVADIVLSFIEKEIQEEILVRPKTAVVGFFQGRRFIPANDAQELVDDFANGGDFRPRREAEDDGAQLQALPVVIVRNASGHVLRLRRRERAHHNPLHEKVVIWAGGHVRQEDANGGNPVVRAALRELKEELRLDINPDDLSLVGAVYVDVGGSTSQHVALCYEWWADSDDVAVALSSAEFFERRGTSVSGSFVSVEQLGRDLDADKLSEPWTAEILENVLNVGSQRRMF